MEVLRTNYSTYSTLLNITGLWPYDKSLSAVILRTVYTVLSVSLIGIQIYSVTKVDNSPVKVITSLSLVAPILVSLLRYLGFIAKFGVLRSVYGNYENDFNTFKDPVEQDMLRRHMEKGRRLVLAYIGISCGLVVFSLVTLLVPTILHSKYQLHYLRMYGFYFNEQGRKTDLVSMQLLLVSTMGYLSIAGTESTLAVYTAYFCGLFEVASYRIQNEVNNVINSVISKSLDIRSTVEVHRRAMEMVKNLTQELAVSYLLAVITVVASFAINLYRQNNLLRQLLLASNNSRDVENLIFTVGLNLLHFIILFLNNYIGQGVKDSSIQVYYDTCNSLWYCIPPKSQKLLLFLLLRSKNEIQYDLAGLFTPCYEGFSMMMSSSFSYFTFLYSTQ
ncbi:uncharacterized protein LOC117218887 isoform X2 [Megalopta genalis]|uniref:uncharacterized protein LOC117218887 isoform X2 n=1 Tax=Megalopta genalis TaxID=115081 RepID=UPI003FCFA2DD